MAHDKPFDLSELPLVTVSTAMLPVTVTASDHGEVDFAWPSRSLLPRE
jgi:hypothetical protein